MCAISGLLTGDLSADSAQALVEAMSGAQRHRGPDGGGSWNDGHAYLGHRRLAIIDLRSCAAQPMTNEDGSVVLICNGEIYNYRELRAALETRGHAFKSNTDIEVILHLYEEHGDRCVEHLVGMFAFAIWDTPRQRLLLARDRIGEKPLYYAALPGGIAFASEIPALLRIPGIERTLDEEALAASLIYPSSPAPLTMFAQIRAVPPATRLVYDGGHTTLSRYWKIDCSRTRRIREADAIEELDGLMQRAVRGTLMADVPVGVLLSGGVDSSAIAFYAATAGANVQTFSVGYDTPRQPDPDLARAREVARQLGLPHRVIPFSPFDLALLPSIIERYAQPFNVFPMLYADQLAAGVRQHVTVALGGNGADEAFGGYRGYNRQLIASRLNPMLRRMPAWVSRVGGGRIDRLRQSAMSDVTQRRAQSLNDLAGVLRGTLFTTEFAARTRDCAPGRFVAAYASECSPRDYLDTVMYSDLMVYHQHGTTVITDVSGMAHSLEIRAPFLDHRLLEFVFSLPRPLKVPSALRPNLNKYVLKRSLERSLPRDVLYGRKYGFGFNIRFDDLLRGPWRPAADVFVRNGRYLELGVFSRKGAAWALEHSPADVWRLLVFALWAEIYVFREPVERISSRLREAVGRSPTQRVA